MQPYPSFYGLLVVKLVPWHLLDSAVLVVQHNSSALQVIVQHAKWAHTDAVVVQEVTAKFAPCSKGCASLRSCQA